MTSTSLNAGRRATDLDALASARVDVLVVGGGIVGVGTALDAASRGLSVALIERGDLAHGTSRWSSKLIHGGLRYLASGDLSVAYESAVERGILLQHTAPHLVRALPSVIPLESSASRADGAMLWAGLHAGDLLRAVARTPSGLLPRPRRLGVDEMCRRAPTLDPAKLRGGLLAWDGQVIDDARLVVAVARTAAGFGARIITRCAAIRVNGEGARVRDELTGSEFDVRARAIVSATGVWADQLATDVALRPSRGAHLVVPAARLGALSCGITVKIHGTRNRFAFALPAGDGRAYLGITDEPVDVVPPGDPMPSEDEVDALLRTFDGVLRTPLHRGDVLGSFAGLRPLLAAAPADTADLSRRHVVRRGEDGVITVVGGKLTTYRRMGEDAVDAAIAGAGLTARGCVTARLPLVGAASRARLAQVAAPARLIARYGLEATRVLAEASGRRGTAAGLRSEVTGAGGEAAGVGAGAADVRGEALGDAAPVAPGQAVTTAEFVFALRHEGALDADDLLDRRTRIGLVPADRSAAQPAALRAVAQCSGL